MARKHGGRGHNIGGKGESHSHTGGSLNRSFALGLHAQQPGFKLKSRKLRRH